MKTKTTNSAFCNTMIVLLLIVFAMHTKNYAQNWTQINSGTTKKINTICFTSSTIGYLGGNDSLLMKTTDGGATWNQLNYSGINFLQGGEHIINMQFLNDNVGFITVGPYSGSYGTTDGGITWNAINLPGNQCYNQGLFLFDENNGFIGGSGCFQGELISYISSSPWLTGTWTPSVVDAPSFNPANIIVDIQFYNANYGLAVSKSGYVFRTVNGGLNWDSVATPAPLYPLTSVLIINDTIAYAGYDANNTGFGLFISTDAGLTWTYDMNSATFFYPNFLTLHKTNNGEIYTGGNSQSGPGVIFRNVDGFSFWNLYTVDKKINDIASYGDSIVFAVGDSGYIVVNYPQLITSQLNESKSALEFKVYPNPVKDQLNIYTSLGINQNAKVNVTIFSGYGQVVSTQQALTDIDVSDLRAGIYFLEVIADGQIYKSKFVKE